MLADGGGASIHSGRRDVADDCPSLSSDMIPVRDRDRVQVGQINHLTWVFENIAVLHKHS